MHDKTDHSGDKFASLDSVLKTEDKAEVEHLYAQVQFALGEQQLAWKRIVILEQQVANQALVTKNLLTKHDSTEWKSQAAATQATEHLYAPLRSDTKPLLEMSAFVRKVASTKIEGASSLSSWKELRALINEAQEILKRST